MPLSEVRTGIRRSGGLKGGAISGRRTGGGLARLLAVLQVPLSLAALGLVAAVALRGPDALLILHGLLSGGVPQLSIADPAPALAEAHPPPAEPLAAAPSQPAAESTFAESSFAGSPSTELPPAGSLAVAESSAGQGRDVGSILAPRPVAPPGETAIASPATAGPSLRDFERRWREDRRSTVETELTGHPPAIADRIAAHRPRLMVISAHQGAPNAATPADDGQPALDYGAYLERKLGDVGTIVVEVKAREPSVIFATATRAVDWRFVFAEGARVLAVHVEGAMAPTVTGVPLDVPLTVRSRAYGDRGAAGRIRDLDESAPEDASTREIRANLARFQETYGGLPMTIFEKQTLARVTLVDEEPASGAGSGAARQEAARGL